MMVLMDWVAIHDGVRPLVSQQVINESYQTAAKHGSAIATISLKNSIRELNSAGGSKSINRENYRLVQTPQTFDLDLIKKAYELKESDLFTDDASVWEAAGHKTMLFQGSEKNLKITTIQDILIAEVLMKLK